MRGRRRWRSAVGLVVALVACGADGITGPPAGEGPAVLFVGNSLTYTNDLPEIVAAISLGAGDDSPIRVSSISYPGYALEDHWNRGDALDAIDAGGWDFVVLQQGPSTLPASREHLVEWTERFAERIRAAGGRPVLYSVWPVDGSQAGFDATLASYSAAAEAVDGLLVPAGEAWRAAWRRDDSLSLTLSDGFHPSLLGSVIAATSIWHALTGRSPIGLPATIESQRLERITMSAELASIVQQAVAEAQADYGGS